MRSPRPFTVSEYSGKAPGVVLIAWHRALAELKAEAARGYLGMLWWVVEPLLLMGALYLVFEAGVRLTGKGFVYFVLCGLIPWKWFASCVQTGSSAIAGNVALIRQIYFPKYMLVLTVVFAATLKFLIVLVLLVTALAVLGELSVSTLPFLVPTVLVQAVLSVGVVALSSSAVALVPDLKLIIDNGLLLLFFLSGVFFELPYARGEEPIWFAMNPLAQLLKCYRAALLGNSEFEYQALVFTLAVAGVLLLMGLSFLAFFDRKFAKIAL